MKYKMIDKYLLALVFIFTSFSLMGQEDHSGHKTHKDHKKHEKSKMHEDHESEEEHKKHQEEEEHDDHGKHKNNGGHDHGKHKKDDGHGHGKRKKDDGHGHGKHEENDDHGHGGGKAIGNGKAIEEIDEKKGFKLSKEAIKTLKLKLKTVNGSIFEISKSTLVASKNIKGVYRFRAGFFKLLPVKILKEVKGGYKVEVKGVDFGDQIVIDGVGLLRVSDVYSTDKSEYGHAH